MQVNGTIIKSIIMLGTMTSTKNLVILFGIFCLFLLDYINLRSQVHQSLYPQLRGVNNVTHSRMIQQRTIQPPVISMQQSRKPVMHTFFEPVKGGCCGMTEEGHANLLHAWETAWKSYGWDTKVLNEADARSNPYFNQLQSLLIEANVNEYDRKCFARWLAMANQDHGGWMTDYDNFPLTLTADKGLDIQNQPGFKSFQFHVPALLHGDKESWNRILELMMKIIKPDLDVKIISDMQLFLYLHEHLSEQEMGVSNWENVVYNGFPYVWGGPGNGSKIDCQTASSYLTAHLSHKDSQDALTLHHTYPRIPGGMQAEDHAEKRAEAASMMMHDYRNFCSKI